jgi:hypothetical protein
VRAWRDANGGSQADGRAAWKRLSPQEKLAVKAEAASSGATGAPGSTKKKTQMVRLASTAAEGENGNSQKMRGVQRANKKNQGVSTYHAWIAAYRQHKGVDLQVARAAYRQMSEGERAAVPTLS